MDDAPPPPYSLHDPRNSIPTQPFQPQYVTAFNASLDGTPTPNPGLLARRTSGQTPVPARYSGPSLSPVSPVLAPPTNPQARPITDEELEKAGFVSAAPYFQLRTPIQATPRDTYYHHLALGPDARPDNLPFPQPIEKWTSRGVDNQDWMTFLNHLFPPHRAEKTGKGSQELEADADLDMGGLRLGNSRSRDQSRPLLGNRPGSSTGEQDREMGRFRRMRIEAVASQWNKGFFGPRGLEVLVDISNFTPPVLLETTPRRSTSNVLQKRPPPEAEDGLLHQAVAKGKKKEVKLLLDKGVEDIEALNKKSETCLYRAVSKGEKDIVQLLLENNADPTTRPPGADSPIHIAVHHDRKSILKLLVQKSRVGLEEPNSAGETPLYVAVRRRHNSCIEILLEAGANPNLRPQYQESMLNISVSGDHKSVAKLLLQRGVDLEELNKNGETPLVRAISRGQTSMVKVLLEYGASAAARTSKGEAPLSIATARGDKSIVLLLLAQKDIEVEVENEKGQRPLYTAICRGDTSIAEQLLKKGADASKFPPGEETTLNLVVGRGNASLTYLLLERGADFEEKNRSGESPLFQGANRGDTSIVSLLLGKGADANTRNPAGESALQRAVYQSNTSIVSLLLGKGANPNLKVISGDSPLYQGQ